MLYLKSIKIPILPVLATLLLTFDLDTQKAQSQNRHQNAYGLGMDLVWYCSYRHGSSAKLVLREDNAYGWKCEVNGRDLDIDVFNVCQSIYGVTSQPIMGDFSDRSSWYCTYPVASRSEPNRQNSTLSRASLSKQYEECNSSQILTAGSCAGDNLESEEQRLYELVNQYRAQNGLPSIPISPSLTLVANRHAQDLDKNINDLTHAWSNCPYDSSDESTYPCMWQAPQRLGTPYTGFGYENAYGGSGGYRATAESALQSWIGSRDHNDVILNQGVWKDRRWKSLGIGIYRGYAVLWFGEESDPASSR